MINHDKIVSRTDILNHVWDENANFFNNTVDVHIRYLRKQIDDPFDTSLIKTIKGQGYMLCSTSQEKTE
jgi:DNA-binding response OmpR family regulator